MDVCHSAAPGQHLAVNVLCQTQHACQVHNVLMVPVAGGSIFAGYWRRTAMALFSAYVQYSGPRSRKETWVPKVWWVWLLVLACMSTLFTSGNQGLCCRDASPWSAGLLSWIKIQRQPRRQKLQSAGHWFPQSVHLSGWQHWELSTSATQAQPRSFCARIVSVTTTYNTTDVLRNCLIDTSTQHRCVRQVHQTVALYAYESCDFCCKQQFGCNLQIDHDVHVVHLHIDETAVKPRKNLYVMSGGRNPLHITCKHA